MRALSKTQQNPYQVLGIDRRADAGAIKRAYFKLVREYPPEQAPEKFQEIRKAYDVLKSPEERAVIDMFLLQPPPELPKIKEQSYDVSVHPEDALRLAAEVRLATLPYKKDFRAVDLKKYET
jgi:curved DNA-binding protein CbpA